MVGRVLFLRHAETPWNGARRWQGWADVSLTKLGRKQTHTLGVHLKDLDIDALWSSDLRRALETAEIISATTGVSPVQQDADLRERDVGAWTGLTDAEIEQRWPGALAAWRARTLDRPPGGETTADVATRAGRVLRRLLDEDQVVLAITHAGVIHQVEQLLGLRPSGVPNLGGRWVHHGMAPGPPFGSGDGTRLDDRL